MTSSYIHPDSGREYREGDPAHHFAQLSAALASQCERFLEHYRRRLDGHDYLQQYHEWLSDPGHIAQTMGYTIEALDKAYTAVTVDRTLHEYGLGKRDEEWERKYGRVSAPDNCAPAEDGL
jgi:hypothetical protein